MSLIKNDNDLDNVSFADSRRIKFGFFNASAAHSGYFSDAYSGFVISTKISQMDGNTPHTDSDSLQILICCSSSGTPFAIRVRSKIDEVWGDFKAVSLQ